MISQAQEDSVEIIYSAVSLGCFGRPEEIAKAVLFLASKSQI